jgi:hypothetical protein
MHSEIITETKAIIEASIVWRRSKMREFPDDRRLSRAISLLEGLADEPDESVPVSMIAQLYAYHGREFKRGVQEAARHVGFQTFPRSLPEFVEHALEVLSEQHERVAR